MKTHTTANIHPDCHVSFEKNYYSAPHDYRGQRIDIWATDKIVEIFHDNNRIATHNRLIGHGQFSTIKSHYPEAHKCYAEATPSFLMSIAKSIGPETNSLVVQFCKKAMELNQLSYGFIERVLKNNSSLLSKMKMYGMLENIDIRLAEATTHGWGHTCFVVLKLQNSELTLV